MAYRAGDVLSEWRLTPNKGDFAKIEAQFKANAKAMTDQIASANAKVTTQSNKALGNISKNTSSNIISTLGQMSESTKQLGQTMTNSITLPLMGVAGIIGKIGLDYNSILEQNKMSMSAIMGSSKLAGNLIEDLKKFSTVTPYQFMDLTTYAKKLVAVGTSATDIIPILTAVGDATSAMGSGKEGIDRTVYALQQIKLAGRAYGQDMMQLTNAGIPIWDALAARIGTTTAQVRKLNEEGKITATDIFQAITNYSGSAMQKIRGMMEVQAKTFAGMMSNMRDILSITIGDKLQPYYQKMVVWLGNNMKTVEAFVGTFIDKLVPTIVNSVLPVLKNVGEVLGGMWKWFSELDDSTQKFIINAVLISAAIGPALTAFGTLLGSIRSIASLFKLLPGFAATAGAGMSTGLLGPIGLIIAGIGKMIWDANKWKKTNEASHNFQKQNTSYAKQDTWGQSYNFSKNNGNSNINTNGSKNNTIVVQMLPSSELKSIVAPAEAVNNLGNRLRTN